MAEGRETANYLRSRPIIGSLWITLYGTVAFFYGWGAMMSGPLFLAPVYLVPAALFGAGLYYLRPVLSLRPKNKSTKRPTLKRKQATALAALFLSYAISTFLAGGILFDVNRVDLIWPAIILIVGLHFFPLAVLFKV